MGRLLKPGWRYWALPGMTTRMIAPHSPDGASPARMPGLHLHRAPLKEKIVSSWMPARTLERITIREYIRI